MGRIVSHCILSYNHVEKGDGDNYLPSAFQNLLYCYGCYFLDNEHLCFCKHDFYMKSYYPTTLLFCFPPLKIGNNRSSVTEQFSGKFSVILADERII